MMPINRFATGMFVVILQVSMVVAEESRDASFTPNSQRMEGTKAGERKELSGIAFRWCPAGTFMMGSPSAEIGNDGKHQENEYQVSVTLSHGIWVGETELTQKQWQSISGTTPWRGKDYVKEGDQYPAIYIDYDEAVWFCEKLTRQERSSGKLPKGWKYSLPTEAQWEYACRAGTSTRFSFGTDESRLGAYGWFAKNSWYAEEKYAHMVGLKQPNAWGLKDMHGNVLEWCGDR